MAINFLNPARLFEVNGKIVEWDMKRAGLNIIRELELLPVKMINELDQLPKKESDMEIGKLQIKDKVLAKELDNGFTKFMKDFLKENELDIDLDVISIKKDACFVINHDIKKSQFGNFIQFIPKNTYHAFIYLEPFMGKSSTKGLEMYFQRNGKIDVKNLIGDTVMRERILALHEDGILNFIASVIDLAEKTSINHHMLNTFLHNFVEMYKRKELDFDYYREFSVESRFRYQFLGAESMVDNIDESMLEKVNIEYNYINIILPIINLLV